MIHALPSPAASAPKLRREMAAGALARREWRGDARFFLSAYAWGLGVCFLVLG